MSVDKLSQATGIQPAPKQPMTFSALLEQYKPEIQRALPAHLSGDRMVRIALTEFKKSKTLQACSVNSIVASIIIASQLGLEPGVMGQGWLVPYKGQCQFIPGWQGYVELLNRAGRASVWTGAIRQGDTFSYHFGTHPSIDHQPGENNDGTEFTHVYAVGWVKGAAHPVIEVWSRNKVKAHLKQYNKVGDKHYALQNENNFEMYGRKVALLQVIKYMPKSTELATAFALDNAANTQSGQKLTIESAKEMAWLPSGDDEGDPESLGGQSLNGGAQPGKEQTASEQLGINRDAEISGEEKKVFDLFEILNMNAAQRASIIRDNTKAGGKIDYETLIESLEELLPTTD